MVCLGFAGGEDLPSWSVIYQRANPPVAPDGQCQLLLQAKFMQFMR
jgi:hypothetical protein